MKLSELKLNEEYIISDITDSNITNYLYEMGVLPGSKIKLLRQSILYDSLFQVDDVSLVMDKKFISLINVRLSES